jgi:recombination protein RecR
MNQSQYPSALLQKAVTEISRLPGIGSRTALRLALHLLKQDVVEVDTLVDSIKNLRHNVNFCKVCHNISDTDVCEICGNESRDKSTICVVENVRDVMAIEGTMQYKGVYHVLGGVISPMDGIGPSDLQIESLVERVKQGGVEEVILALSPTMEGDTTNFYIYRKLQDSGVKVTVIARGVAQNDELQYTDEVTLGRALAGRVPFKN